MSSRLPSRRELRAQAAAAAQSATPLQEEAPLVSPLPSRRSLRTQAPVERPTAAQPAPAERPAPAMSAAAPASPTSALSAPAEQSAAASLQMAVERARHADGGSAKRRRIGMRAAAAGAVATALLAISVPLAISLPGSTVTALNAAQLEPGERAVAAGGSVLDSLQEAESRTAALAAVPQAATRARARQALENPVKPCTVNVSTAADGLRAAYSDEAPLFRPMVPSSYDLTSPFGYRVHPVRGTYTFHEGVDYAAPIDTPIFAPTDGEVKEIVTDAYGTSMTVSHEYKGEVFETAYLHLYPHTVYVEVGQRVTAGQHIAGVGNSGVSTGPHLHFEVHIDGKVVDPEVFLADHDAVAPGSCD
ncbi:M23 family metallopeptidase [Buchananella felis]|uniref:M23 family metallopeptidase n=1 Tax=Buchananella felis TaxID=3231492 RepID=UPI003529B8C3